MSPFDFYFTIDFILCCVFSLLFGYLIGYDREKNNKPAGIVTHTFVILGSALFTMLSLTDAINPSRIAANIVTGIGFIGAGMIIKSDEKIENLTTAAGIWAAAAIGMALGFKMHLVASLMVLTMFLARQLPHPNKKSKSDE